MAGADDPESPDDLIDRGADDEELVSRAAWYYYNDGLTQGDVAIRLGVSRIKVSRLLEKGRQSGLIHVHINSPHEGCFVLQQELASAFGLTEARVIPALDEAPAGVRIGRAAANFLISKLTVRDLLAIGWGEAATTALRYMSPALVRNEISLVSMTGGVSAYVDSAGIYGPHSNFHIIPTPLRVTSHSLAEMLRAEPYVRDVMAMALTARIALVGIGAMSRNASLVRFGYCTASEIELFARQGAVGDILGYFYDRDGQILPLDLHQLVVAVPPDQLFRIPTIVAAAAGPDKVDPILGALRGRIVNILITDETTAAELLRRAK
jgi:lsr operon transcriptional repressor